MPLLVEFSAERRVPLITITLNGSMWIAKYFEMPEIFRGTRAFTFQSKTSIECY